MSDGGRADGFPLLARKLVTGVDGEEASWCRRVNKQIGRCSQSVGSLFLDHEKINLASFAIL
jgi:hypothetical protein